MVCLPAGSGFGGWMSATLGMGNYRYTEHRLEPHGALYAIGSFKTLGGVSVENPERAVALLLREWKQDQPGLLARFDADHDGVLSADEWDRARAAARDQVASNLASTPGTPGMNVLSKPADGRPFLLSGSDEETLARRLRLRAAGNVVLFIASAAALAWMLSRL